jgi:hypothetical protein
LHIVTNIEGWRYYANCHVPGNQGPDDAKYQTNYQTCHVFPLVLRSMIEKYAWRTGCADLRRECLDNSTADNLARDPIRGRSQWVRVAAEH